MDNNATTPATTPLEERLANYLAEAKRTGRTQGFDHGARSYEVDPDGWISSY
jgi:hypothetical protein